MGELRRFADVMVIGHDDDINKALMILNIFHGALVFPLSAGVPCRARQKLTEVSICVPNPSNGCMFVTFDASRSGN